MYTILDIEHMDSLDYSELIDTSKETSRRSVDGTKFVIEFDGEPECLKTIEHEVLTHGQAIDIMATEEWSISFDDMER